MRLMKYKDILALAKEKIEEAKAPLRSREMCKKAELEVCKLESLIADHEQKIQEYSSHYPIDFDSLLDTIDSLELTQRRKEQFEKLINQMFGD